MADKTVAVKIDVNAKSLGELEDDLQGINTQIDKIESSAGGLTIDQKFQGAAGAIKGFAGAVEAAVGATVLLGIESKVFEQYERYALGAISFGRGIFDLTEAMNDIRKSTVLANIALKAQDVLNKATAISAKALGVATNTASLSFKTLKVAIASTGIGLLVVGIGFLIEKLISLASNTDQAAEAQERLNAAQKTYDETLAKSLDLQDKKAKLSMQILKEQGATEEELEAQRRVNFEERKKTLEGDVEIARKRAFETKNLSVQELQELKDRYNKSAKLLDDFIVNEQIRRSDYRIQQKQDAKQDSIDLLALRKEFLDDWARLTFLSNEERRAFQIKQVEIEYAQLLEKAKIFGFSVEEVEKKKNIALTKLKDQFRAEDLAAELAYRTELNTLNSDIEQTAIDILEAQTVGIQENTFIRLQLIQQRYDAENTILQNAQAQEAAQLEIRKLNGEISETEYQELLLGIQEYYADQTTLLNMRTQNDIVKVNQDADDAILRSKLALWSQLAVGFGNLSQLFEQGTAAAKTAALAQIAINTAVGYVQGLDIAQKSAAGTGPAAAFAFPIFYATQIAAVLGAAVQAKRILSTQKSAGSPSTSTAPSTSIGSAAASGLRQFNQGPVPQPEAASACMRTYVLTGDVTSGIEAEAKLSRKRNIA